MAVCLGIISLRHYSVCECVRRDLRFLIALALIALALKVSRSLALLQVGLWSWDSPIPCKPGGEVDNGPHPRVGGFVPGRGAALSLRSRTHSGRIQPSFLAIPKKREKKEKKEKKKKKEKTI